MASAEFGSDYTRKTWEQDIANVDHPVSITLMVAELERVCEALLQAEPRSILAAHDERRTWYQLQKVIEQYATVFIDKNSNQETTERTLTLLFLGMLASAIKETTAISHEAILVFVVLLFLVSEVERPIRQQNNRAQWRLDITELIGATIGCNPSQLDDVSDSQFAEIVSRLRPSLAQVLTHYQSESAVNLSY